MTLRSRLVQQLLEAPEEKLPAVAGFFGQELPPPSSRDPPPEPEPPLPQPPGARRPLAAMLEGDPATGHFSIRFAPAAQGGGFQASTPSAPGSDRESLSIATKIFQLLSALDPDKRLRKAAPITIFLLRFRQNLSRSQIAVTCECSESLVAKRLSAMLARLPWQPRQLRELSAYVEAMEDALSDSRARRIHRKSAVYGEEHEDEAPQ